MQKKAFIFHKRLLLGLTWQEDAVIGNCIPYDVAARNEGLNLAALMGSLGLSKTERHGSRVPVGVTTLFI